jgi:uncharacterized membrane protein YccC
MKDFILKNKVLLSAIISAIILVLQQSLSSGSTNWKAIGFAAFISVLGVIANQWKGQGVTMTGIIGTLAGVFYNNYSTGVFTWNEFILSALLALLMAVAATLQPEKKDPEPSNFYKARI